MKNLTNCGCVAFPIGNAARQGVLGKSQVVPDEGESMRTIKLTVARLIQRSQGGPGGRPGYSWV